MKVLIAEDERHSQEVLTGLIKRYDENLNICSICDSVESGIELIRQHKPELVLLDIDLKDGNGFDLLKAFPSRGFSVIFVTGYDHFGIQAIKQSALDYIVKPVGYVELSVALDRTKQYLSDQTTLQARDEDKKDEEITISSRRGSKRIRLKEVLYFAADAPYVAVQLMNGSRELINRSLVDLELELPAYFMRIHKGHIINLEKVSQWDSGRGGTVKLEHGTRLPIAYRYKKAFVQVLSKR